MTKALYILYIPLAILCSTSTPWWCNCIWVLAVWNYHRFARQVHRGFKATSNSVCCFLHFPQMWSNHYHSLVYIVVTVTLGSKRVSLSLSLSISPSCHKYDCCHPCDGKFWQVIDSCVVHLWGFSVRSNFLVGRGVNRLATLQRSVMIQSSVQCLCCCWRDRAGLLLSLMWLFLSGCSCCLWLNGCWCALPVGYCRVGRPSAGRSAAPWPAGVWVSQAGPTPVADTADVSSGTRTC